MSLIILSVDDSSTPAVDPLTPGTEAWARELIAAQFLSAWPVEIIGIMTGDPPTQVVVPAYLEGETQPSADRFALCSFQPTLSKQTTIGTRPITEHRGYAWIKLWTPAVDDGRLVAAKLVDAARRVFNRKQLSSSLYVSPLILESCSTAQTAVDGKWFMQAVSCPLRYYEQG